MEIQNDFDQIARLPSQKWDHNIHFFKFIQNEILNMSGCALDVGCGKGELCYLLASQFSPVTGIDLSGEMISAARKNQPDHHVEFLQVDYLSTPFGKAAFDLIVSVATIHHMNFKEFLFKAKSELKSGGKLIIIDLYKTRWSHGFFGSMLSKFLDIWYNLIYNRRIMKLKLEHDYWAEHGKHDTYMEIPDITETASAILGHPKISRELFWRYSLVWNKD